jgi:hypothetical protein
MLFGLSRPRHVPGLAGVMLVLSIALVAPLPTHAQREPGSLTVGVQAGRTSGLTVKLYRRPDTAYEALLTFDGDDFVQLGLFRLRERPVPDSLVHAFYGPGVLVGERELTTGPTPEVAVGAKVGINFYAERFEVFVHITPATRVYPDLAPVIGGGFGLRYDLYQP